jgi:hypothetical protein
MIFSYCCKGPLWSHIEVPRQRSIDLIAWAKRKGIEVERELIDKQSQYRLPFVDRKEGSVLDKGLRSGDTVVVSIWEFDLPELSPMLRKWSERGVQVVVVEGGGWLNGSQVASLMPGLESIARAFMPST